MATTDHTYGIEQTNEAWRTPRPGDGRRLPRRTFAAWAAETSRRTNRSLAGSTIRLDGMAGRDTAGGDGDEAALIACQAQDWGLIPADRSADRSADFDFATPPESLVDAPRLTGAQAMAHAAASMPVLHRLMDELKREVDFHGVRIAACLILEPKTAILLRELKAAGAIVGVYCGPDSTDPRVAEQLRREGVMVESDETWTPEQAHAGALRLLDRIRPDIIIDDGASFARLASMERPELTARLIGVAEETTSGVRAFQAMQDAGALDYPVIAVNDSVLKTGFDNTHGTGETCVTTMQRILGVDAFGGARVTVIGYGPVGKGFATRVRALGARVTVCDVDPVAALRAVFDGFAALDIDRALPGSDIVVSATGVRHTVTLEHLRAMRPGATLAVIGGIANEIALDEIPGFTPQPGRDSIRLDVPDGPTVTLLADGDGVNYTVGGGNPIEIMDLSFAVQASAVAHLLRHRGTHDPLEPGLQRLDADADRRIAAIALASRGYAASHAVADNGYDWTLTRFAEHDRQESDMSGSDAFSATDVSAATRKEAR